MDSHKYDGLKLENQICFPLYACSKEIIRRYKPLLDKLDLTYTQYITMMVLWEKQQSSVKALGEMLYLDSGTLTPVLKKLEAKGYIERHRCREDERSLVVTITEEGYKLRERALVVPEKMSSCVNLTPEDAQHLYQLLYKALGCLGDVSEEEVM
ncbi:MAG: MarR family transcriptional regulator [Lachnospiraceae bacterium]|nr:MarR family transcriptional regulator [Lachnospiraceae bacterium]